MKELETLMSYAMESKPATSRDDKFISNSGSKDWNLTSDLYFKSSNGFEVPVYKQMKETIIWFQSKLKKIDIEYYKSLLKL